MTQAKRFITTFATLALTLVFVSSGTIYAQGGDDGATDTSTSTSAPTAQPTTSTEQHSEPTAKRKSRSGTNIARQGSSTDSKVEPADSQDTPERSELHKKGDAMIAEMRKEHKGDKEKTPEQHKKVCEAHKKGLGNKFTKITGNSQRTQTKITSILDKAVAYQIANNVQAADFDSLVSTAQTAKLASADSITALQAITPTLDCNSTSVAGDVATFKVAAQTTRTNLKAYHAAVKAVIQSLKDAKPASTSIEGSNQ